MSIDETTELRAVARTPEGITETSEESEAEALVAELASRMAGIRSLAPSRTVESARAALREELARMVATCQQLDAHLSEAERADRDAATAAAFADWATGGGQR